MNNDVTQAINPRNPRAVVVDLLQHHRPEYIAQIAGVRNISSVYRWANGTSVPTGEHWRRLRIAWRTK